MAAALMLISLDALAGSELDKAICDNIAAIYSLDPVSTEIEIRKNKIVIESGDYDSLEVSPMSNAEPRGLIPFKVSLYKEGAIVKNGQVRVRISCYDYALVTTGRVKRHDMITLDKFEIRRVETTYISEKVLQSPDELINRWARKNIGKDQIITSGLVEQVPAIISGKNIYIMYKTPAMEITAPGVALEAGYIGDRIRVRNSQSRKVIACTIMDRETVQVDTH